MLLEEDTALQRQFKDCSESFDDVLFQSIPASRESFVKKCLENLRLANEKKVGDAQGSKFCNCALDVMD